MKIIIATLGALCLLCIVVAADENKAVNSQIEVAIHRLGTETKAEDLAVLRTNPVLAVALLADQIKPISTNRIVREEQKNHPAEMHVIWSIRALRYLSGLDFTAQTEHQFNGSDEGDRAQFLHLTTNREVTFFGVWMSRDSIYVAPEDAQRTIIKRWQEWVKTKAKTHRFAAPKSIDEWYF